MQISGTLTRKEEATRIWNHKGIGVSLVCLSVMLLGTFLLIGCQTPGKVISVEESVLCPKCKAETRTSAIKGINYTTCICPDCKTEYTEIWDGFYDEGAVVHVCDNCKMIVEKCAACRKG